MNQDNTIEIEDSDDDSSIEFLQVRRSPTAAARPTVATSGSSHHAAATLDDSDSSDSETNQQERQRRRRALLNNRYQPHSTRAKEILLIDSSDDDDDEVLTVHDDDSDVEEIFDAVMQDSDEAVHDELLRHGLEADDEAMDECDITSQSAPAKGASHFAMLDMSILQEAQGKNVATAATLAAPNATQQQQGTNDDGDYDSDTSWNCSISQYDISDDELCQKSEDMLGYDDEGNRLTFEYWTRLKAFAQQAKIEGISFKEYTLQRYAQWQAEREEKAERRRLAAIAMETSARAMEIEAQQHGQKPAAQAHLMQQDNVLMEIDEERHKTAKVSKPSSRSVRRPKESAEVRALADSLTCPPLQPFRISQMNKETKPKAPSPLQPKQIKTHKKKEIEVEIEQTYETYELMFEDKEFMTEVKHLCSLYLDPETNLPVKKLTLHKPGSHNTMYDFLITVKPSKIANGGYGAFLKYVGARRLIKNAYERGRRAMKEYKLCETEDTEAVLQAVSATGHGVAVKLTGDCLEHSNSTYIHKEHNTPPPSIQNGIGLLGMFTEDDYEAAPNVTFETTTYCVSLGCYGPFRKEDRLDEETYTIKNYIFGNGPAEYAFDVPEKIYPSNLRHIWHVENSPKLKGRQQVIDITDDFGMPHEIARKNIPMYVNECSPRISFEERKIIKNVFLVNHDERRVDYLIYLAYKMNEGDEEELVTEYGTSYDDMRNRQNYGPKLGVKSDSHFPSRLERDNSIRRSSKEHIDSVDNFPELTALLVWVQETWEKLYKLPQLDDRLVVAVVRIQGLLEHFKSKIEALMITLDIDLRRRELYGSLDWYCQVAARSCLDLIKDMRISEPLYFYSTKSSSALDVALQETQEQVLFAVSEKGVIWPCEESVWTKAGGRLLEQCSLSIAKRQLQLARGDAVQQQFAASMSEALESLKLNENMVFESGLREFDREKFVLQEKIDTVRRVLNETKQTRVDYRLINCQTPKALLFGTLGQANALNLDFDELCDARFIMTLDGDIHDGDYKPLASVPQLERTRGYTFCNDLWYKVWQIGFPVLVFQKTYPKDLPIQFPVECVAKKLGIDPLFLTHAIESGMHTSAVDVDLSILLDHHAASASTKIEKQNNRYMLSPTRKGIKSIADVARKRSSNAPVEVYRGPPTRNIGREWPAGWLQKGFERQGGKFKGHVDYYWYTPVLGRKIRSIAQVHEFLDSLARNGGDEEKAWNPKFGS
ncbi:hypothetical protein MPSEU_000766500 [Mayamaea pseudoterrestris]|nr:hypothetical protein MPSEU_000766500 [Mayamaea pseudoterrestris]